MSDSWTCPFCEAEVFLPYCPFCCWPSIESACYRQRNDLDLIEREKLEKLIEKQFNAVKDDL